ncbi:GTPase IMAP family member 4-like [Crotalus adamanteus]|uniref:GTPase IMAP family member 4-like n=1 Tax=Crotalus adamanteus TaxID=8729 RepID=A0AAW1B212_CROAD
MAGRWWWWIRRAFSTLGFQSPKLSRSSGSELVAQCGHRCLAFNNKAKGEEREAQVAELMRMIDQLVYKNGDATCYTEDMLRGGHKPLQRKAWLATQPTPGDLQRTPKSEMGDGVTLSRFLLRRTHFLPSDDKSFFQGQRNILPPSPYQLAAPPRSRIPCQPAPLSLLEAQDSWGFPVGQSVEFEQARKPPR